MKAWNGAVVFYDWGVRKQTLIPTVQSLHLRKVDITDFICISKNRLKKKKKMQAIIPTGWGWGSPTFKSFFFF